MGRLPGLDQRGRLARDGATGSEQGEHPARLFDYTGPTREDVKSSEEGLLARLFGHQTLGRRPSCLCAYIFPPPLGVFRPLTARSRR